MFDRMIGALLRAILVALMVALPSLLLPGAAGGAVHIMPLVAFLAAVLTFAEYKSVYPSIVEFRDAPPFNRLRFVCLALTVTSISLASRHAAEPSTLTALFHSTGTIIGHSFDFPYSPVRLVLLSLPEGTTGATVDSVRTAAGLAYMLSALLLVVFILTVRLRDWPHNAGVFNVWVNLPLFDPTAGGDVLDRLRRDAHVNVMLGFLLPFLIPAILKVASDAFDPISLADPQTLVWSIAAWAFLPASMIMRGVALARVAEMIQEKRRQAYAKAELVITA